MADLIGTPNHLAVVEPDAAMMIPLPSVRLALGEAGQTRRNYEGYLATVGPRGRGR